MRQGRQTAIQTGRVPHIKRQLNPRKNSAVLCACKRVLLQFSSVFHTLSTHTIFTLVPKLKQTAANEHGKGEMAIKRGQSKLNEMMSIFL